MEMIFQSISMSSLAQRPRLRKIGLAKCPFFTSTHRNATNAKKGTPNPNEAQAFSRDVASLNMV
jgi:hypothetical protein